MFGNVLLVRACRWSLLVGHTGARRRVCTLTNVTKPTLLDLCCGGGGAAAGYAQAGFRVTGVDRVSRPSYPFEFVQADALDFARAHGRDFDVVHASPPCQAHISITAGNRRRVGWTDDHVDLITPLRAELTRVGRPFLLENGPSRAIRSDVVLCGLAFGLPVFRHRAFELSDALRPGGRAALVAPPHVSHRGHLTLGWRHGCLRTPLDAPRRCPLHDRHCVGTVFGVYGSGGGKPSLDEARRALDVAWLDRLDELNEAVPPAYTRFLGRQLLSFLRPETGPRDGIADDCECDCDAT